MTVLHQNDVGGENLPTKHVMTVKRALAVTVVVGIPQVALYLTSTFGTKEDLLTVAAAAAGLASLLAFAVVAVWHMYEKTHRLYEHFRHTTDMLYIKARGFAFSHAFILSRELEELIRDLLPDAEEADRYHSGLARGIAEARNPDTYRTARRQAAAGTRFYLSGRGLSNRIVRATPGRIHPASGRGPGRE